MGSSALEQRKGARTLARRGLREHRGVKPYIQEADRHVKRMLGESDRGVLVLSPTMIEDALEAAIIEAMPGYENDQHDNLFGFDSPIGTFSRKTLMARALGVISPELAEIIDVIRHMRNAAAHAQIDIDFSDANIVRAVEAIVSDDTVAFMRTKGPEAVRHSFVLACLNIQQIVLHPSTREDLPDEDLDSDAEAVARTGVISVLTVARRSEQSAD